MPGASPAGDPTHEGTQALGNRPGGPARWTRFCWVRLWLPLLLLTACGVAGGQYWHQTPNGKTEVPSFTTAAPTPGWLCPPGHTRPGAVRLVAVTAGDGAIASSGWGATDAVQQPRVPRTSPTTTNGLVPDVTRGKSPRGQAHQAVGSGDQAAWGGSLGAKGCPAKKGGGAGVVPCE